MYNNNIYATLDDFIANASSSTCGAQTEFKPLSPKWEVAPDDQDSRYVVGKYSWGTRLLILSNGNAYNTNHNAGQAHWRILISSIFKITGSTSFLVAAASTNASSRF